MLFQWVLHPVFMCNHSQGHVVPSDGPAAAWRFLKDYTFQVGTNPYATSFPSVFPSYCAINAQPPVIYATNTTVCPTGTYFDSVNLVCQNCPGGSFSSPGATSIQGCSCLPGFTGSEPTCTGGLIYLFICFFFFFLSNYEWFLSNLPSIL